MGLSGPKSLFTCCISKLILNQQYASQLWYSMAIPEVCGKQENSEEDSSRLQGDTNRLEEWAVTWQMKFNSKKCEVTYLIRK